MGQTVDANRVIASLKSGSEPLTGCIGSSPFTLLDFWRWSVSDILSNATRGRFAEFIVATATGVDITKCRNEWSAFDLETPEGIKIEVKSAAYLQSWHQSKPSKITFSIRSSLAWDSSTGKYETEAKRQADVYVFSLLHHEHKETVDPLNLDQWKFFVLATAQLDSYTKSRQVITLKSIMSLTSAVRYDGLKNEVHEKYEVHIRSNHT
jgi:hypothetical protein